MSIAYAMVGEEILREPLGRALLSIQASDNHPRLFDGIFQKNFKIRSKILKKKILMRSLT